MKVDGKFNGAIAGIGTSSGVRLVIGMWPDSPLGSFADVMVQTADGTRILLAPNEEAAEFVSATYSFDHVRIQPVKLRRSGVRWGISTPDLTVDFATGRRHPLGWLLQLVPRWLSLNLLWTRAIDPIARVLVPGVRTVGTAGNGRGEWYSALDMHNIQGVTGTFDSVDLGDLRNVSPPVTFGFGSTPQVPSLVRLVTTVRTR
ncbi:hypothetical protein EH165_01315 [Nakamurella antarctica]|uniref:Uncharacterized protein n=1 Tax=Nakamurella antarctica TaxID=1902245 RepID=A0A3G8ZIK4_9ACTN|nr:hypothetical protein [Nakamurella antarctica]AZI57008.1 hypothetical protein EH165_01315 [Nakamurella antarctica]